MQVVEDEKHEILELEAAIEVFVDKGRVVCGILALDVVRCHISSLFEVQNRMG